jgi:hypothetical protein
MTATQKEFKRLEALEWIEEAYGLLDQAHANLRDLGLQRERFGNSQRSGHTVTMQQVVDDTNQLRNALGRFRFCDAADCWDEAAAQCENCESWFCGEHGSKGGDRQVQDVGPVAYPACCDGCREVA